MTTFTKEKLSKTTDNRLLTLADISLITPPRNNIMNLDNNFLTPAHNKFITLEGNNSLTYRQQMNRLSK